MNIDGLDIDLKERCIEIRRGSRGADTDDVVLAEAAADTTCLIRDNNPGQPAPPEFLANDLHLLGWFIYEVSWSLVRKVATDWSRLKGDDRARSEEAAALVARTATAARSLAWPEYAPRALGAIRAQALAMSKKDTSLGYLEAWGLHRQASERLEKFLVQVPKDSQLARAFKELSVQLNLAETGTACRQPERIVSLWNEAATEDGRRPELTFQEMFQRLTVGASAGTAAIAQITQLHEERPLPRSKADIDELNLLTLDNFRNPGIMTARAHLILLPMTTLMNSWGRLPSGHDSWDSAREDLIQKTIDAYRVIERTADNGIDDESHRRSVVQVRLNIALVHSGCELPSSLTFAECLQRRVLDDDAVTQMSRWLAAEGKDRGDANLIGSAMMPQYLAALKLHLEPDGWKRYINWRRQWPQLDREVSKEKDDLKRQAKQVERLAEFENAVIEAERICAALTARTLRGVPTR